MQHSTNLKRTLTGGMALMATLMVALLAAPKSAYAITQAEPSGGSIRMFYVDLAGDVGNLDISWLGFNPSAAFLGVNDIDVTLTLFDNNGNVIEQLFGAGVDWPFAVLADGEGLHQIFFTLFDSFGNAFFHAGDYVTDPSFQSGGGMGLWHVIGAPGSIVRWTVDFP